jgi:hypothetical protein
MTVCEELLSQGLVEHCPDDGEGCNAWNYRTVLQLMVAGLSDEDITSTVRELSNRSNLLKLKEETQRHIERARDYISWSEDDRKALSRRKRPLVSFDYECLVGQVDPGVDPYEVLEDKTHECHCSGDYLSMMFRPGERACVLRDFRAKRDLFWPDAKDYLEDLMVGPEGVFFLSNPVLGTAVGGSFRSRACITDFRHLVVECDHPESKYPGITDNWLRYLVSLELPIKSVVTSGGKSVHAIIDLGTSTEFEFERVACQLHEPLVMSGADPNSLTSVRLTRLPFSYRVSKDSNQELLYVNPNPAERAITNG